MGSGSVGRARGYKLPSLTLTRERSKLAVALREDSDWRGYARRRDVLSGTGSELDSCGRSEVSARRNPVCG